MNKFWKKGLTFSVISSVLFAIIPAIIGLMVSVIPNIGGLLATLLLAISAIMFLLGFVVSIIVYYIGVKVLHMNTAFKLALLSAIGVLLVSEFDLATAIDMFVASYLSYYIMLKIK